MLAALPLASPPFTLKPFRGPADTIAAMIAAVKGPRGERSMVVRSCAEHIVRGLQPKDYLSEILAVRNFVAERCRFTNDALTVEMVSDPERLVTEIAKHGIVPSDCDDISALAACLCRCIGREADFVTVGFGKPNSFSHVFARVVCPKPHAVLIVDPVAGMDERAMAERVRSHRIWRID